MNLTIDIGNTCVKTIIFRDTVPVYRKTFARLSDRDVKRLCRNFPVQNCILSSVIDLNNSLLKELQKIPHFERLSSRTKIPIKNLYDTPATLGNDRLANAIAGSFLFPRRNVLIIDAGTCIKYDFINSKREYLGGSITPGMEMRFKALHQYTGKLPLVRISETDELTGSSTKEAIQTGVVIGITEEIKGFIHRYKKKYKSLEIIFTGGDAWRFAGELKLSIFAASDMVNIGLNEIIRFNTTKRKKK